MRRSRILFLLLCWVSMTFSAHAATGSVIKVLPLFLDLKGRSALTPSLYDRDAYQAVLLQHPEQRSGTQYAVQWKSKDPVWEPLQLQIELRGAAQGGAPKQVVLAKAVQPTGWLGTWTYFLLEKNDYKKLGEVTAWRVSLWEGNQLLGTEKSFLW